MSLNVGKEVAALQRMSTAPYPNVPLAFCGALALQAVLDGRKVRDEADNVTWSVATKITCPGTTVAKREFWQQTAGEFFAAEWDLLLCSAGSLSAMICEAARQMGRKAIDVGQLDQNLAQGHDFA